uniref:ParA family protein n=1 Tax=Alistipes onderdonkii TaxID=328813 RepID=UPI001D0BF2F2|nr:ParA family protein [Alistipes onderdonkii]
MNIIPASIAVCNQKGGAGKSTFTVLLANYLHYIVGHDVLVVDCDYPQWSIHAQRERELSLIEHDDYHKLLLIRQFNATGRKLWPLLKYMPPEAPEEVGRLLQNGYNPRIILYDLTGTVNAEGVIRLLASLDAVFVPLKADKVVMESALSFARSLTLRSVYLFWTMIDRRERTPLYDQYEAVIRKLGLSLMTTHIPYRSKFNKELLPDNAGVGRSTLLAPERTFAREAQIETFAAEILTLLNIR